ALRAASLSELSVSIAHELNQPLQAVVANAGAFQRWLNADPPNFNHANRVAQKIIRNADAAAQVITRIRALFSKTEGQPHAIDLNAVIHDVCDLLADRLASSSVKLNLQLDPGLPATAADHVQMEQVVLNLVRNGIEAMQDVSIDARSLRIVSRQNDGTVEVEVRDSGRGFSDPERIFEAFYTTKPDGMGMGLAICHSIIEAHRGRLWAENVGTGGASITFRLPIRAADSTKTSTGATISA
ncbi:ATP-binding protein, partial [Mesorhizobium sp.]